MPDYVDGFVLPMPKKNLKKYQAIAAKAGKIWKELGALDYRECVLDDPVMKGFVPAPKKGETLVFAWITYKSKAQRDRVNKLVMKDPRIAAMMDPNDMPFDMKKMFMAGFETIVHA